MKRPALFRVEHLLAFACLAAAIALLASELMATFALRPPGGETQRLLYAADRHHYAMLVLAILALVATVVVVMTGSRIATVAVVAAGAVAAGIFLVIDLPHVNQQGTLADFASSQAVPVSGFWLEMVSALLLALCGAALATLEEEQLQDAFPPAWLGGAERSEDGPESADKVASRRATEAAEHTRARRQRDSHQRERT